MSQPANGLLGLKFPFPKTEGEQVVSNGETPWLVFQHPSVAVLPWFYVIAAGPSLVLIFLGLGFVVCGWSVWSRLSVVS